jgi:Flp pilus assembly protein TadG
MSERRSGSRGQALAEFAIVVSVLVLLVVALFDAGRAVINYTELSNAARAGARVAMVNQSADASCTSGPPTYRCAAAEMTASMGITASDIALATFTDVDGASVSPDAAKCAQFDRCLATVKVEHTFEPITPFVSVLFGDIVLSAETTMQIERRYASPSPSP